MLAEESNDLFACVWTASVGMGTNRAPARPCMTEPMHNPLFAAGNTIATVKDVARMAETIRFVLDVRECRHPSVVLPNRQQSAHCNDLITISRMHGVVCIPVKDN